jgi:hypothetical protein
MCAYAEAISASAASTSASCSAGFTFRKRLGDLAISVDHERGALVAEVLAPVSTSRKG